jgi:hypothetical protein
MTDIGMDLLNPTELAALGLSASSNLFSVSHEMATAAGRNYTMSPVLRTFSFLNRWFIFRRRSTNGGIAFPAAVTAASAEPVEPAAPAAAAPRITPDVVADFERRLAEATNRMPAPQEAPVNTPEAEEEEEEESDADAEEEEEEEAEPEETEPEEAKMVLATGPAYPFYYKSAAKDDLKIKEKGWRRLISTFAPFTFKDPKNSSIIYPNLEAVIGALKYQLGSTKPELGAQLFSTTGNIYQKYLEQKRALGATPSEEDLNALSDDLGIKMRDVQKPAVIKKTGATFTPETYVAGVEVALAGYLKQRYDEDAVFRKILDAVKAEKVRLVAYTATAENELTGVVAKDGSVSGSNILGRTLMKLVGLTY